MEICGIDFACYARTVSRASVLDLPSFTRKHGWALATMRARCRAIVHCTRCDRHLKTHRSQHNGIRPVIDAVARNQRRTTWKGSIGRERNTTRETGSSPKPMEVCPSQWTRSRAIPSRIRGD